MAFVYDGSGNRSQRTDYNGAITNYSYDALNRLTTIAPRMLRKENGASPARTKRH